MTVTSTPEPRTGLWHKPEANYSFGLGPTGSIVAVGCLIAVLIGFVPASNRIRNVAVIAAASAIVLSGFIIRDQWDRTFYSLIRFEAGWHWHRLTGRNFYAPTWWSKVPVTKSGLPGLLADTSIGEMKANNTRYGFIIQPITDSFTVVFEAAPLGASMATPDQIETYEANWQHWLSTVCQETGVLSVQVVTEAAHNTTDLETSLDQLIETPGTPAAHLLADSVDAIKQARRPTCRTWVAVTWRTKRREMHNQAIPARLDRVATDLAECGAGPVTVLSRDDICRVWALMWDPSRRDSLHRWPNQVIHLNEITPCLTETRRALHFGGSNAVTLSLAKMPHGVLGPATINRLADPVEGIDSIRWAELFRPVQPSEARHWADGIERGIETRLALTQNRRKKKLQDEVDEDRHRSVATALIEGAHLVRVGFAVTATYPDTSDQHEVTELVRQRCGPISASLRTQNGAHLPTFVACLPGGITLPNVVRPPNPETLTAPSQP